MRVEGIEVAETADGGELAAHVDGFRVFYRVRGSMPLSTRGDVWLAVALMPAMRMGEPLELPPDAPVCPQLLAGVERLQEILTAWYPILQRVSVRASIDPSRPLSDGVASFYSGGVDGGYTLLKQRANITHLVYVEGIDTQLDNASVIEGAVGHVQRVAAEFGKAFVRLATNVRFFGHRYPPFNWNMYSGGGLASLALALAMPRCYIAASHHYSELFPWGSHPLTDPLWSTAATTLVHDGAEARRSDKLRALVDSPRLLEGLRVCWQDDGYNCGRCDKCLRTMATLRALKASTPALPPLTDLRRLRTPNVWSESELSFLEDNLRVARGAGDTPLVAALSASLRRYRARQAIKLLDRALLGGALARARQRWTAADRPA